MFKPQTINLSLKVSLSVMVILAVFNLVGSNFLATQGHELQSLNQEYQALQKENSYLKNEIAQELSLANLENWASSNGFVKISNPVALNASTPVAYVSQ